MCLFLCSGNVKGVCSNKTTSYNLISNSHYELKGIDGEKERESNERRIDSNLGPIWHEIEHNILLLDQTNTTYCAKSVDIQVYEFVI